MYNLGIKRHCECPLVGAVAEAERAMSVDRRQHPVSSTISDRELTIAARSGDASAWDMLVDRHAQALWTAVIDRGLDPGRASEVCALTWHRCVDHLDEVCAQGEIGDWLIAAASLECLRRQAVTTSPAAEPPARISVERTFASMGY